MSPEQYAVQIDRLKDTYGDRAYPDERVRLIYKTLGYVHDWEFERVCNALIANKRAAPMLSDIVEELQDMQKRDRAYSAVGSGTILEIMKQAKEKSKNTRPDIVKACMELLNKRLDGKITMQQFEQGCDWIDGVVKVR